MAASGLGSRGIIGRLFYAIEQIAGKGWIPMISMLFTSDQATETYKWLGQTPMLREWVGGRQSKGLRENGITVENLLYEATLEIDVDDIRRDKTGQVMVRINDLANRAVQHWAKLVSALIQEGDVNDCYDGQKFFDTDHTEGDNTTNQSNDQSITIADLPVPIHGSTTDPSVGEMSRIILLGIQQILNFKDDQNEPINDGVEEFVVMTPTNLWPAARAAVKNEKTEQGQDNPLIGGDLKITHVLNSRLTDTNVCYIFRANGPVAPFIRQVEIPNSGGDIGSEAQATADIKVAALAENSEEEFKNHRHLYGVEAQRNVAYAYWQYATRLALA